MRIQVMTPITGASDHSVDPQYVDIGIEGAELTETANGEGYWIAVTKTHNGLRYSHSVRIAKIPTYQDIENARETFKIWWAETIKDQ